jgi:hypothetical protein
MDRPAIPLSCRGHHPWLNRRHGAKLPGDGRGGHRGHANEGRLTDEYRSDNSERFAQGRRGDADLGKGQRCVVAGNGGGRRE